jgi:ABC-type branched-subunit amino acid transport system substrate-binding protein
MRRDVRRESVLRLAFCLLLLSSCTLPGSAVPVVKIGLIAPFEGLGRPLGYQLLPAVKIALEDANATGELGRYRIALVVLNDDLEPATAARQAQALAADDSLLGALGPWTSETAAAAAQAFGQAGLPALVGAPLARVSIPGAQAVFSLCPSFSDIAAQLLQKAGQLGPGRVATAGPPGELLRALAVLLPPLADAASPGAVRVVLYSGGAAAAAEELARRQASGGQGVLLGGPDLAQPWLAGLAGQAAEGTWALACSTEPGGRAPGLPAGVAARFAARYQAQAGAPPGAQAMLAYWGARRLVGALAEDVRAHGGPSRAGLAAALGQDAGAPGLVWLQIQDGSFVPR